MANEAGTESSNSEEEMKADRVGSQTLPESLDFEEEREEEAQFVTKEEFERMKVEVNSQKTGLASKSKFVPFTFTEILQDCAPTCFQSCSDQNRFLVNNLIIIMFSLRKFTAQFLTIF